MDPKETVKKVLRNYFPDIPMLRDMMTQAKLRQINQYVMEPEDVAVGEGSVLEQVRLVGKYFERWPKHAVKLLEKLDDYAGRSAAISSREDLAELRYKCLFACLAYGYLPDEYFVYELEDRDPESRRSFISDRELSNLVYESNDIIDIDVYFNKFKTYETFREYYRREAISVTRPGDWEAFEAFAQAHPTFVVKNVKLSKGNSVRVVNSAEHDLSELFAEMLADGEYIVEELVTQSETMSQLSLRSVNTVRFITLLTDAGVNVVATFLKSGRGTSFVDNGAAGGILVGIDKETGVMNTPGYDEFLTQFDEHPDTHVPFVGFQMPDWQQAIDLAKEMSAKTPNVRYVGWDFAHTNDGWVVIEGNGASQIIGPQIVWKRGFRADVEAILGREL